MPRLPCLATLGLVAVALAPLGARANPTSITVTSPFYTSPLPTAPYWTNPYWAHPYWATPYWASQAAPGATSYVPGSSGLPRQPTNPAAHSNPMGNETCVAPPYTCPAPAPYMPGAACTCATNEGRTVTGTVH